MKIPQYIINALKRANFHYGKDSCMGYSIQIHKFTRYEYVSTLRNRCDLILTWCNNQLAGAAEFVTCPKETCFCDQYAVITIYDPIMLYLEKFIKN